MDLRNNTHERVELSEESARRIRTASSLAFVPLHLVAQGVFLLKGLLPWIWPGVRNSLACSVFDRPLAVLPAEDGFRQMLKLNDRGHLVRDDYEVDLPRADVEIGEDQCANGLEICVQRTQKTGFLAGEWTADEEDVGRFHTVPRRGAKCYPTGNLPSERYPFRLTTSSQGGGEDRRFVL